jgi:nucleoside-diphosphate-sugar epimerase
MIAGGDSSRAKSVAAVYRGEETVIHLSSIFHIRSILAGCRSMKLLIAVSSTGVFSAHQHRAGEIAACERTIEISGVDYTILRPTMIYGTPEDRNIARLIRLVKRSPLIPLPATGASVFQPVHVRDLASAILASLKKPESIGKSYNVAGGSAHSLREIVEIIAGSLGKKVAIIPVPLKLAYAAVKPLAGLGPKSPLKPDQILRLLEDKSFDYTEAANELGYRPVSFQEGVSRQIREMGLLPA